MSFSSLLLGEGRPRLPARGEGGSWLPSPLMLRAAAGAPSLVEAAPPMTPSAPRPSGPARRPPAQGRLRDPVGWLHSSSARCRGPRCPPSLAPAWPPAGHISPRGWCDRTIFRRASGGQKSTVAAGPPSLRPFEGHLQCPVCSKNIYRRAKRKMMLKTGIITMSRV